MTDSKTLPQRIIFLSKIALCASVLMLICACGGQSYQLPQDGSATPDPIPVPLVITSAQVFSNVAQTWNFRNGYGDLTTIEVIPQSDGSSLWHFTKSADRAYWRPGVPSELWFHLRHDPDNAWRSDGFTWVENGVQYTAAITLLPGWPGQPYTIIPAASNAPAVNTAYAATSNDGNWISTWTTYASLNSAGELISKQCEAGTSGACDGIQEIWHFRPGIGLQEIEPIIGLDSAGHFIPLDPMLTLTRI